VRALQPVAAIATSTGEASPLSRARPTSILADGSWTKVHKHLDNKIQGHEPNGPCSDRPLLHGKD